MYTCLPHNGNIYSYMFVCSIIELNINKLIFVCSVMKVYSIKYNYLVYNRITCTYLFAISP